MVSRVVNLPKLSPRPTDGHKGLFGRVLLIGGSDVMLGAPILAGTAALRMGAGLVQVAMPKQNLLSGLSITPELIGLALSLDGKRDRELLVASEQADAIAIGPGLGQGAGAKLRVAALIREKHALVIDADALNILAAGKRWPAKFAAQAVLTPHPGEMKRLLNLLGGGDVPADERGRLELACRAAKAFGQVLVLKGNRTVVADAGGGRVYVNRTGDSSLSKAGAGDVLTGVIGALLAIKMDRFDAAIASVWIHGRAGELAGQRLGRRCVLARDVIDALPAAIKEYEARA